MVRLATLRPEFLEQLLLDPDLAAFSTRPYTPRSLRREALRTVIEKPARLAGIEVDGGLVDRLVDAELATKHRAVLGESASSRRS